MPALCYEELEDLAFEHAAFLRMLQGIGLRPPAREDLARLFHLIGELHHRKEEEALFPLLLGSVDLEVGGPKCMTFFTPRVIGGLGWTDAYARLSARLDYARPTPEELEGVRVAAFREGSMLRIPLEDHIVGTRAVKLILADGDPARSELLGLYVDLLRDHIQREDECLFPMMRRVLEPSKKARYAEAARAIDEREGTHELLRELEARLCP